MKYVAKLTIVDAKKNAAVRPQHLKYLNQLYLQGNVVMAGPFADRSGGLVIYEAENMEEARRLAENDPVIVSGARTLELHEWPTLEFPLTL
jgi:uncharacterized protein YciI